MTHGDTINLDDTGEVRLLEMPARAEMLDGRPRLIPRAPSRWLAVLKRNVGRDLTVVLVRAKQRRSHAQNRYLWGVVYVDLLEGMREKAIECGAEPPFDSVESVHEWAKWKFLSEQRVLPGGEVERVPGSTRTTMERFCWLTAQLSEWGRERDIHVRQPREEVSA